MNRESALYDRTGASYARTRRPDGRIADQIVSQIPVGATVVNVGAGAGSYEPPGTILAVEPSRVMIAQRPAAAAPAVQAVAEEMPVASAAADVVLAVLTVHHWTDLARGIGEMVRIAKRRIVILTWDAEVMARFWLLRDYLPAAARTDSDLAVPLATLTGLLSGAMVTPVMVPANCSDGFGAAFWRRPEKYLDPTVRAGMSMLALTPDAALSAGLGRLSDDLRSGRWHRCNSDLLDRDEFDAGYRLVTWDLPDRGSAVRP